MQLPISRVVGVWRAVALAMPLATAFLMVSAGGAAADTGSGLSKIAQTDTGYANLRSCPGLPDEGDDTGECTPFDQLATGTHVQMLCWISTEAPYEGTSAKWYWVQEVDGDHPGWRGYVWSDLVDEPTTVGECDGSESQGWDAYHTTDEPDPGYYDSDDNWNAGVDGDENSGSESVSASQGPAARYGYRYAVTVAGATPNSSAWVECFDSVDNTSPFYEFSLPIDADGNGYTESQCYSSDGPDHWVVVDGVSSNAVSW